MAISLKSNDAEVYFNRGNAKSSDGQDEAALDDYTEAIEIKPDYAEAYYNRGNLKDKHGQSADALSDYDLAIRTKPDYAEAYLTRGNMKFRHQITESIAEGHQNQLSQIQNQADFFLADYDLAIESKPNYANAYVDRGKIKKFIG